MFKKGQGIEFWRPHIESMMSKGQSCRQYGAQHGLSIHSLQWWRRQIKGPVVTKSMGSKSVDSKASGGGHFVAVRVRSHRPTEELRPAASTAQPTLYMNLRGGASLEFPILPTAQWLAQFAHSLRDAG